LHELTEQIPKTIYVNQEQSPKPKPTQQLEQKRIDFAFRQSPRVTKNKARFKETTITLLSGKFTNDAGVETIQTSLQGGPFRVTDIERTLIDCCVRPFYSGGIFEVMKAFTLAKDNVSIQKLTELLKRLDYTYPYHQVIGFYLEKAKYPIESQEILLTQFDYRFDFYLTHGIKKPRYSEKWRLFYPEGF
jgi:predicted transcriptional regulator of viral defense system